MLLQVKTGRGADSNGIRCGGTDATIEFQAIATGGRRSDWFGLGTSFGANSFNTFDLPILFGLIEVRGGAFRIQGHPAAASWHLSFFNITDGSSGIWRSEPRQCLPVQSDGHWTEYEFFFAFNTGPFLPLKADENDAREGGEVLQYPRLKAIEKHPEVWKNRLRGRDFFPEPGRKYWINSTGNSPWSLLSLASKTIFSSPFFYKCVLSDARQDPSTQWEFTPAGSGGGPGQTYLIRNVASSGRYLNRDRSSSNVSIVDVEGDMSDPKSLWVVDYAPDEFWFRFINPERREQEIVVRTQDLLLCKRLSESELENWLQEFSIVPVS